MTKKKLPPHLAKLFDTPEKRKRADNIWKQSQKNQGFKVKKRIVKDGYIIEDLEVF